MGDMWVRLYDQKLSPHIPPGFSIASQASQGVPLLARDVVLGGQRDDPHNQLAVATGSAEVRRAVHGRHPESMIARSWCDVAV